ncbi:GyrI-like domain-containing protein [Shewanella sp. 10N.261.52.F9]|uniref:GyrI-like domain-containing protein n=1 Tax=Shewanella sp. 10N.261.52.F9 TaxID=3229684 RepID=UPI003552F169
MSKNSNETLSPQLVNQPAIKVFGLAVTTSNEAEQHQATQKIMPLWQAFMQRPEVSNNTTSPIYGCYYHYESDHNGQYSILAGLTLNEPASEDLTEVDLVAGKYLKFGATGEMPAVIIALWQQIWHYFEVKECPFERCFDTDYECYTSTAGVDIYIGVN